MLGAVVVFNFLGLVQEAELMLLVDRVSIQLESHPKYDSWRASVISTTTKMDKNWQPKKVVTVQKEQE